ncbi:hypothetical protein P8452_51499 [Trifolium repens]|nr:hypothetical protein P8452_51499 [Trifolium repens]
MRQFVCNKHGYRDKKHLCKIDMKREHKRLTRTGCASRLRVQYKPKKDRYVVSIFEEGHNHELTPSKRCGRCESTTHNARSCSVAKKAPVGKNVKLDSVSLTDSVNQTEKNKKRKTSCKGEPSVQKNCSDGLQNHGDNVTMRQIPSMYAVQPMMFVIHPGGHPMQVQPVYPIYGMPVGENSNSCFGLLQQVMKSAVKE